MSQFQSLFMLHLYETFQEKLAPTDEKKLSKIGERN